MLSCNYFECICVCVWTNSVVFCFCFCFLGFFLVDSIPMCRHISHCLSIPLWWLFGLLHTKLLWIFVCNILCGDMLSFLMGKYLEVEWLGPMVDKCLNVYKTAKVFSKLVVPSCIFTRSKWECQLFHFYRGLHHWV